jgi:predicted HTH domain antitoxin
MATIEITLPEDACSTLHKSPGEISRDVRIAAAAQWFAEGLVSQGRAAELAGLSRAELLTELGKRKISVIQMTPEELETELLGE